MTPAIPTSANGDLLRMKEALRRSLHYLYEAAGQPIDERILAPAFEPSWKTHGFYHAAIRDFRASNLKAALANLQKATSSVSATKLPPRTNYFLPHDDSDAMSLIRGELALNSDRAITVAYTSVEVASDTRELEKTAEGIDLLKTTAPRFHDEFAEICDEILLSGAADGVHVRSASSFNLFGLVIIWADPIHSPIYYLRQIVHEIAHLRLFLVNIEDPLVLNPPDQKFCAPFRDDARPMLGIFHAYFVLARMVLALREVRQNLPSTSAHHQDLFQKLIRCEERFLSTAREIDQHGLLTECAKEIYLDCWNAIEANCVRVEKPWDYSPSLNA